MKIVGILRKIFCCIICFFAFTQISYSDELPAFNLIYEGVMPSNIREIDRKIRPYRPMEQRIIPFCLNDAPYDYLLYVDIIDFIIYQFYDKKWESRYQCEIDSADYQFKHFLTGDIDNDNTDEVFFMNYQSVAIYDFKDGNFHRTAYELPYYPEDALIGDVDNDSLNELVMLCSDEPDTIDRFDTCYNLCIYDYNGQNLALTWSDNQELQLTSSNAIVPPKHLMCIADIDNTGYNKLIMPGIRSDVSPTYFNVYHWNNNILSYSNDFRITELSDTLITTPYVSIPKTGKRDKEEYTKMMENSPRQFVFSDAKPTKFNGSTYILVDIMDKQDILAAAKITGNKIIINRLNNIDRSSWKLQWFDIDGNGTGILNIYYPRYKEADHFIFGDTARFEYYR